MRSTNAGADEFRAELESRTPVARPGKVSESRICQPGAGLTRPHDAVRPHTQPPTAPHPLQPQGPVRTCSRTASFPTFCPVPLRGDHSAVKAKYAPLSNPNPRRPA